MIGLTETWLKADEFTVLNEALPPGYTIDPRIPQNAEVLLTVANFNLQKTKYCFFVFWASSHEIYAAYSVFIATVYRPPGPYTTFLTEFPEFLSADNIQISGD